MLLLRLCRYSFKCLYNSKLFNLIPESTDELKDKEKTGRRKKFPNQKYMSTSSTFSESSLNEVEQTQRTKKKKQVILNIEVQYFS